MPPPCKPSACGDSPVNPRPLALALLILTLVFVVTWWLLHRPDGDVDADTYRQTNARSSWDFGDSGAPGGGGGGYRVNVNTADAATLQLLPGVGPSLAKHIIRQRETRGPFTSMDELDQVRMIGPVLRERLEPWVRFDAAGSSETAPNN